VKINKAQEAQERKTVFRPQTFSRQNKHNQTCLFRPAVLSFNLSSPRPKSRDSISCRFPANQLSGLGVYHRDLKESARPYSK